MQQDVIFSWSFCRAHWYFSLFFAVLPLAAARGASTWTTH